MSTLTLLTVMQVIGDRKTANLKELERVTRDNRVKNKEARITELFARIDECDKILNLLKDKFDEATPTAFTGFPINRSGNNPGQVPGSVAERIDPDALGQEEKSSDAADLAAKIANAVKSKLDHYASPLHALTGPDPLHPV